MTKANSSPSDRQQTEPKGHDIWQRIADSMATRSPLVAATVVRDRGSVPRRTGAKMLIYADGTTHGTIGGGIFEATVVRDALVALAHRRSVTRSYSFNP